MHQPNKINVVFVIFFQVFTIKNYKAHEYCSASICNGTKDHTLCQFEFTGPSSDCVGYERIITSVKDKHDVVDKINLRRDKVASGEIRSFPAAAGMMKMGWNDELAVSAQRWADQCITRDQNLLDSCRDLENTLVGQNVATIYGESPGVKASVLVDLWYTELLHLNSSVITSYKPSSSTGSHYDYFTQLVWAVTNQVGCGGVKFQKNTQEFGVKKNKTICRLVCNFAPKGNVIGEPVYPAGRPCSKCPKEYLCDSEYPALCHKSKNGLKDEENIFNSIEKYESYTNTKDATDTKATSDNIQRTIKLNDKDSGDHFDLLSHLFETTHMERDTTSSVQKCKEVLAVEEFINLLKSKLNNEQLVREYLFTTKTGFEISPSDETVAAMVQQIYSKKLSSTTATTTENENIDSTLLADLVEAIIFRQSDRFTTDKFTLTTPIISDVKPVKIQAALSEVKPNSEFSGHYFFPEVDDDNLENETTESYYDVISQPQSEVAFDFDKINKNTRPRNFLDEILEEEQFTEGGTDDFLRQNARVPDVVNETELTKSFLTNLKRVKRRFKYKNYKNFKDTEAALFVNYYDLLKKLASDLRSLKLRKTFSCTFNSSVYPITVVNTSLIFYILIIHGIVLNIFN